jgi:cell shape-determining protein MreC
MNFHSSTKKPKSNASFIFFIFLIIFGSIFFSPLSNLFQSLASTLQTTKLSYSLVNFFSTKKSLTKERDLLLQKNQDLMVISLERDLLLEENQKLKSLQSKESLIATVLLHPGFSPFDTFIISKGSIDGVVLGDLVRFNALILGEISEVNEFSSRVTLFSSSGQIFPVIIGQHHIEVEARGLGGGTFEALIPNNIEVSIGDTAIFAYNTPRLLGVIQHIEVEKNSVFKKILFGLPININSIEFVSIDKKINGN